jgi:peptidoglycan/xylan/chitin deacetylase (PgdA/CDA1 family)
VTRVLRRVGRVIHHRSTVSGDVVRHVRFLRSSPGYGAAYFNLTVDFELAWSIARRGSSATTLRLELERSRRARRNLPALLELCDEHQLPVTFAVVAHVALDRCTHADPPAYAPAWLGRDWYSVDPRSSLDDDRDYYGADLVREVISRPVGHELASHSFGHVDLGDEETPAEVARFELTESRRILSELDPGLRSFVFPKNHARFLDLVAEAGYSIYRAERDVAIAPDPHGLWSFPAGLWLSPTAVTPRDVLRVVGVAHAQQQVSSWFMHLYEFERPDDLRRFFAPIFGHLRRERENGRVNVMTMRGIVDAVAAR